MKVIQIVTFTFYIKLPQIMNYIASYSKSLLPTAPAKQQENYDMAGELKIIDLPSHAKEITIASSAAILVMHLPS